MTLAEYLRKNPAFSVAAMGIAGAIALFIGASTMAPTHEANFSFTVDHRELQAPDGYAYDGYYALRAQEIFTDTVVSWFRTPSVIDEVRQTTAEVYKKVLPDEIAFRVKKYSGQNVVVTLTDSDPARAQALSDAAIGVMVARTDALNRRADGTSLFVLEASEPIVSERRFPPGRAGLIGLALGLVLGAIAVFLATPPKK